MIHRRSKPTVKFLPLSRLSLDEQNANRGSARGRRMLGDSLRKLGAGRSVLVDRQGCVIAGNKTVEMARKLGLKQIAVIETDGETLVAVRRRDLDLKTDKRAVELAVADNRTSEVNLDWDAEVLAALNVDLEQFWSDEELKELLERDDQEGTGSSGALLDAISVTIEAPKAQVEPGQVWKLGKHILVCAEVLTGWPLWKDHLDEEGVIFAPYPGPLVPFTLRADKAPKVVMVQPDTYICGHIIDRFREVCGDGKVKRIEPT